jgi:hypothetical protein
MTPRFAFLACALVLLPVSGRICCEAQASSPQPAYPAMAPLGQYLMADESAEIALARSAAPASIASGAEVMVLRREGNATAVKGSNGFVCVVERSWAKPTDDAEFWNPKMRAPTCFNAAAAKTFLPIYLMKTQLVLAGKSKAEILAATNRAMDDGELKPLAVDSMAYMMSRQQYLSDSDKTWHSHMMFFFPGDAVKSWAAEKADSPAMAGNDPEERVTILFVPAGKFSDGTADSSMLQ